jgi:hypothetical protein
VTRLPPLRASTCRHVKTHRSVPSEVNRVPSVPASLASAWKIRVPPRRSNFGNCGTFFARSVADRQANRPDRLSQMYACVRSCHFGQ